MHKNLHIVYIGEGTTPSFLVHEILHVTKGRPFIFRHTLPKDVELLGEPEERLHFYVTIEMLNQGN